MHARSHGCDYILTPGWKGARLGATKTGSATEVLEGTPEWSALVEVTESLAVTAPPQCVPPQKHSVLAVGPKGGVVCHLCHNDLPFEDCSEDEQVRLTQLHLKSTHKHLASFPTNERLGVMWRGVKERVARRGAGGTA